MTHKKGPNRTDDNIIKDDMVTNIIEYNTTVEWIQQVIELESYIIYKYRFNMLYYVKVQAIHTLYPSRQVYDMGKQLINKWSA